VTSRNMAHGTRPDTGAALAVLTVDGFLASKEPKHRFIRLKNDGSVCKDARGSVTGRFDE
jgi:hypothetical protein